jgi:hypothetical protein
VLCPAQIAAKELREKKVPFTIRRYMPDGARSLGCLPHVLLMA